MVESLEGRDLPSAYVWTGAVSNAWSNPANWTGGPTSRAPGAYDTATINSGTVDVTGQLKVAVLYVKGGTLNLVGTLSKPDTFGTLYLSGGIIEELGELAAKNIYWSGGEFVGTGPSSPASYFYDPEFFGGYVVSPGSASTIIKALAGGQFDISGNVSFQTVNFDLLGTTYWEASTATGDSSSAFINEKGGILDFNAPGKNPGTITLTYVNIQNNGTATIYAGTIVAQDPAGPNYVPVDYAGDDYYVFWNTGTVNISKAAVFSINGTSNTFAAWTDGATYDSGIVKYF
jgi:hypothetical protein